MSSGLDRKVRDGIAGKHREKQGQDFFDSKFPERNIWFAVIYRALEEIKPVGKKSGNTRIRNIQKRKEDSMWFFTSPTSRLKWICDNFGIDIKAVRAEADRRYYNLPRENEMESVIEEEKLQYEEQVYSEEMQTL